MANEIKGQGAQFRRWDSGSGTWEVVSNVTSISGPNMSKDTIEVTNMSDSDWRRFISGLKDGGNVSLSVNFSRDGYDKLLSDFQSDGAANYEIVLPDVDKTSLEFQGIVTEFPLEIPLDDVVTQDITVKVTGQPNIESGSGPSASA